MPTVKMLISRCSVKKQKNNNSQMYLLKALLPMKPQWNNAHSQILLHRHNNIEMGKKTGGPGSFENEMKGITMDPNKLIMVIKVKQT